MRKIHPTALVAAGQQVTAEELRTFCKDKLAGYKVPRRIEFRDTLPKTMVGKVLRRELVKDEGPGESTRAAWPAVPVAAAVAAPGAFRPPARPPSRMQTVVLS